MAESRREIEEEELRDILDIRNRNQATDRPERTKPDHLHASQGPLSSIRAAIKRTRSNTQSDHGRDRRRPEITILSAEPLSSTAWFPGASGGFPTPPSIPASQTNWTGSITADPQPPPTYDQVIKEKTQEEHVAKPTAAPRRSTTIATQTDPVRDEDLAAAGPECTAAPQPITERNSAVKKLPKPQKPPRPSLPQPLQSGPASGTSLPRSRERASTSTTSTSTDSPGGPPSAAAQQSPHEPSCPVPGSPHPSVTVHWDVPATPPSAAIDCPATAVAPSLAPSDSTPTRRPTPLPRTKSRPQPIGAEVKVQTLVRLSENGAGEGVTPGADTDERSSGKYLQELLDVFCADDPCEPSADFVEQSEESEDSGDEMSSIHSQRNIRARIQAFESQVEEGIEDVAQPPEPQPRNAHFKAPPIAAKPSLAPRPSFKSSKQPNVTNANSYQDTLNTMFNSISPTPAARPVPPRKPVELSLSDPEPETPWPTKVAVLPPPRSSMLTRAKSFLSQEEEASGAPHVPLGRPAREPLKPNLNLNNHNSAYTDAERAAESDNVNSPAPPVPVKPQRNEGSLRRESLTRRPTTIRVPSQPSLYESQDSPPALPTQKPVSVLSQSVGQKLNFVPRFPSQDSFFSAAPEPALPPRPQGGKVLPARPPPAKAGPGRPPPPRANSTGRAASFHSTSRGHQPQRPRQLSQRNRRTEPMLPPRPSPGHRLYNKYTLETPHGIASYDYNGSSTGELSFKKNEVLFILGQIDHQTFECQVGNRKGPVPESYVKVITPLSSYSAQPASRPAQQGSSGPAGSRRNSSCGLQVQALHDFDPERPGELALRVGDVVSMVEEVDSEWYKGTSRGSSGFFPVNYVKVLSNAPTPINEKKAKPPPARVSGPRCVARFDFEGEHSDELSFSEGDIIQLKEYLGDDWVRGQLGAYTGIFPLNFVDVVEDLPPPPAQEKTLPAKIALPAPVSSGMATSPISQTGAKHAKPIQASPPAVEWAMALYDFSGESEEDLSFQQGDHILVTQHLDADWCSGRLNGREGVFPMAFVETSTGPSPSVATPKSKGAEGLCAKALFDFQSNCDEELSFQVGDIIINLESVDGEWFLGELRGQRALVPKNYVQVLS